MASKHGAAMRDKMWKGREVGKMRRALAAAEPGAPDHVLIEQAILAGKVTKCKPGIAYNAICATRRGDWR